jgi:hypothetical protein
MNLMAMRVTEMGESEGCSVTGQIEVASPGWDKITSPETELTSCWCSARELPRNSCGEAVSYAALGSMGTSW